MMGRRRLARLVAVTLGAAACACVLAGQALAQVRGVYPLGMSATNSGVTPEPGFVYANQLLIYSRDELKGPDGSVLATGNNTVVLDMNTFSWVSERRVLAGAKFSMSATLPLAKNSLTSDLTGPVNGAGGFGDSYFQPFILGWNWDRAAVRAVYGFLAPTGRFEAHATDNVGSGYWTHALSSGQTFYLTSDKATAVSAFQMYEIHSAQEGTNVRPGQTFNLDYSLTRALTFGRKQLQIGLVGYIQRQTTDKRGPSVTPEQAEAHYKVNALGFASSANLTERVSVGVKYFQEFASRSTFQGHSLQVTCSIGL